MDPTALLLGNGFFLSFILLVLLILLAFSTDRKKPRRQKIKDDIKKIKEQIEEN